MQSGSGYAHTSLLLVQKPGKLAPLLTKRNACDYYILHCHLLGIASAERSCFAVKQHIQSRCCSLYFSKAIVTSQSNDQLDEQVLWATGILRMIGPQKLAQTRLDRAQAEGSGIEAVWAIHGFCEQGP